MENKLDRIWTVTEVANYLQISKSKIYYLIQRKEIPYIRLGRNVRVREADLKQWLMEQIVTDNWSKTQ